MQLANSKGYASIVELLLKDIRCDPKARNNHASCFARANGHYEIVMLLLQRDKVDPSDRNNYSFRIAAKRGFIKITDAILQHSKFYYVKPIYKLNPKYPKGFNGR